MSFSPPQRRIPQGPLTRAESLCLRHLAFEDLPPLRSSKSARLALRRLCTATTSLLMEQFYDSVCTSTILWGRLEFMALQLLQELLDPATQQEARGTEHLAWWCRNAPREHVLPLEQALFSTPVHLLQGRAAQNAFFLMEQWLTPWSRQESLQEPRAGATWGRYWKQFLMLAPAEEQDEALRMLAQQHVASLLAPWSAAAQEGLREHVLESPLFLRLDGEETEEGYSYGAFFLKALLDYTQESVELRRKAQDLTVLLEKASPAGKLTPRGVLPALRHAHLLSPLGDLGLAL